MANFLANLWESVFISGPTPTLLVATNITFGALQLLLAGLLFATYSIHFAILSVLSGGLWWSINWFAKELQQAQAKEAEADRLRRRQKQDEADDEGEDTETEDAGRMKESLTYEPTTGDERIREEILDAMRTSGAAASTGSQPVPGSVQTKQRKAEEGSHSASEISTDSEWEKVDETR
ncbi:hypothetical protein DOTSEDRAFT_66178 [Dothistroma septosporum NZE10]|uniref:Pkr1-domain-containing protein n=1 Tax=Dothistroma septosporum (strain NZE10 / CBS 128990) TaxID=675120 RepID=N1PFM5_DOTSN|nr:hypothetical protein DOTSEDRAFT_66178 [Dothistroma septosporum NZE10]